MSTLTGNKISLTYKSLIKTSDNDVLTGALKELSDGLGNNSGVFLNTGGDLKSTGTLEFSNFKATAYAVTINKLVNEADGISNNDNDTSLPTSAAVKDYVDTHVTSQDLDFSDGTNPGAVDLDSQVFAIVGTSNEIETSASGQQLQIGLPNDVTISGTYTGTTFSGDLNGTINTATTAVTQTAGDNSTKVATTAYVDTLDAASDLDFSDGSVNSAVNLNTQVFSIQGTSNEITTTASGQSLTIALDSTGVDLPDGSTAITQTAGDNSTKVATTAYVDVLDAASDLDIAGDTGTGDVNLNTQTLTLQGTTNQVITAVSGQTTTFSLPSTVHRDLQGNVTGNADTATAWQTARDLSLSGEATGILSSVDGTSNISGAVTLTNSAVTGKVLTGLPTPAASTVQPSDSILEGIGKLQSQINGIANGLQFQGTWDAATNTPTLNSGGGEVDSGTTTGQTADKLIDSSQNFLTTVSVGDKVINQVDGQSASVTNVDSNTSLTLDADIMLSGEAYTIDASPFLVQGHYYVVSVGGTTSLNGNANWAIGDWVIAGADNIWSKLDHTQIDGQGTPGNLPVWNTATTLTDSIVSESGTALTVTGSLSTTLGASVTGDLAINTNKFTVNATSGNTVVAGEVTATKYNVSNTSGYLVREDTGSGYGLYKSSTTNIGIASNGNVALNFDSSSNATFAGNVITTGTSFIGKASTSSYLPDDGVFGGIITNGGGFKITTQAVDTLTLSAVGGNMTVRGGGTFGGNVTAVAGNFSSALNARYFRTEAANTDYNLITRDSTGNALFIQSAQSNASQPIANFRYGSASVNQGTPVLQVSKDNSHFVNCNLGVGTASPSTRTEINETNNDIYQLTIYNSHVSTTAKTRIGNWANETKISSNLMQSGGTKTQDNASIASWVLGLGGGTDYFDISRSPAGSTTLSSLMTIDSSANATFAGEVNATRFILPSTGTTTPANQYLYTNNTNTGTGKLIIQSGGGSAAYGGGINLFSHSHASKPGWVTAGISSGSGGKFSVNTTGLATGTDVFTVDTSGIGTFAGNVVVDNMLTINIDDISGGGNRGLKLYNENSSGQQWNLTAGRAGQENTSFVVRDASNNVDAIIINEQTTGTTPLITLANGGNATFAGNITISKATPFITLSNTAEDECGIVMLDSADAGQSAKITYDAGSSNALKFYNNASNERMRITGGTGAGEGSAMINYTNSNIETYGSGAYSGKLIVKAHTTTPNAAITCLNGNVGGDNPVFINFVNEFVANQYNYLARIAAAPENTWTGTASTRNASLNFYTNDAGTSSEKMRITSGGTVLINKTSINEVNTNGFEFSGSTGSLFGTCNFNNSNEMVVFNQRDGSGTTQMDFRNGNVERGRIEWTTSGTTYNTTSDYRLKENVKELKNSLTKVNKLKPKEFNFISNPDEKRIGFIAHEVENIVPQSVSGIKDDIREDGTPKYQALDHSMLVPLLVGAIQELKAEVDLLKQECKCK